MPRVRIVRVTPQEKRAAQLRLALDRKRGRTPDRAWEIVANATVPGVGRDDGDSEAGDGDERVDGPTG